MEGEGNGCFYATSRRCFSLDQLKSMGFRFTMVHGLAKMGACRAVLAVASSADNVHWRVRPLVRRWR